MREPDPAGDPCLKVDLEAGFENGGGPGGLQVGNHDVPHNPAVGVEVPVQADRPVGQHSPADAGVSSEATPLEHATKANADTANRLSKAPFLRLTTRDNGLHRSKGKSPDNSVLHHLRLEI